MTSKRSTPIIVSYVLSLVVTIALLVAWVIYVVRAGSRFNQLAARTGASQERTWIVVLTLGCVLFFVLIVGLTYQLAQSLAARRYSNQQEEFLSTVTHELKSPLAAIKLHAQTLEQERLDVVDRERSIGFILQQAERMGALVDNVLESSRLIARKQLLDLEPVELARFFAEYLDEVRVRAERQGVRLVSRVETGARVMATADALARVMDNLLDNAVRFSVRGGEVRCSVVDGRDRVTIEVADDGIGIPKAELTKVFDRFYQIGRQWSSSGRQGTGLGLSIVSSLVGEMKGTVHAYSQEGKPGTRFVVELPILEAGT